MILGYDMVGQDNDSYMFDAADNLVPRCPACGYVTNYDYVSRSMKIK